ncbi:MAG: DUF2851 family protein [Bacteroidota bacterium]
MKEELLHFIWQSKLLLHKSLQTVSGEPVSIIRLGTYNRNAGPDFFNAKIQIGDTLWAGNVEMHISSSEWDKHTHQTDAAYNNVILHVVYVDDKKVLNSNGETLPTLELRSVIPTTLLQRYQSLQQQRSNQLPCEKIIAMPAEAPLQVWLQRLLVERIEHKTDYIKELLVKTHHHYEQSFYIITARYFGMKTNAQPFEQLANMLPLTVLSKHKNNLMDIMALVLGTSGLINRMGEAYAHLMPVFEHLQRKYKLQQMDESIWKFARTRPANFPSMRLVQFALFVYRSSHLLGNVLECNTVQDLRTLYRIEGNYASQKIVLGDDAVNLLLINSVLPFVFVYGSIQHEESLCDKVLSWYEALPAEHNSITRQFTTLGLPLKNAADGQAYIQLKNEYCNTLQCLRCSIGYHSLVHVQT